MAQQPTREFRAEAVRVALTSGLPRKTSGRRFWDRLFDTEPLDTAGPAHS